MVNIENSMMTLRLSAGTRQRLHRLEQTLIYLLFNCLNRPIVFIHARLHLRHLDSSLA